jgi:AbrB family looped-hinge helix DNA binding protein
MELIQVKKRYTIQENGQVTLPAEWRERYGLKKGDEVVFEETDQGLLVSPREAILLRLLDDIGDELRAKGVTLEELMQDGREIRSKLLKEMYGIEPDTAQE